jgi:transcriptional antiterminator RfaH
MKNWYCIYTKARYEEHVSERLMSLTDIEVLNPKIKTKRYLRGRMKEVTEELFPCYIFSKFNPSQYLHMIKYTRGVKLIIGNAVGNPYVVDCGIIDQVQSRMNDGFVQLERQELRRGDKVEILEGPLRGLEGVFQGELKACDRVFILLNTIEYQARIEIEKGLLAKA